MNNKVVIVIGKNGQLAHELSKLDAKLPIVCLGRDDIHLGNYDEMSKVLNAYNIDSIINAAAYTAVDKAENDKAAAFALNCQAVENLAKYVQAQHLHLVHVSTDYVFRGDKGSPYLVDDKHEPQGVYGESKAAGEQVVANIVADRSCVLRTSWVYSSYGNNFVKTMLRLMQEKPQLGVIDDQIGSPTSASALAKACIFAALNKVVGVHHFTDSGIASWYDFAMAIQRQGLAKGLLDHAIPINPIPTSAYPTPAKRPAYSVLDKSTLKTAFAELQVQHWQDELDGVLAAIKTAQN